MPKHPMVPLFQRNYLSSAFATGLSRALVVLQLQGPLMALEGRQEEQVGL